MSLYKPPLSTSIYQKKAVFDVKKVTTVHRAFGRHQALSTVLGWPGSHARKVTCKTTEDYRSQAEGQTATHTTNLVHHKCPHLHLHHIAEMNKGAKAVIYLRTFLVARSGSILDCPKCPDRCQIFHWTYTIRVSVLERSCLASVCGSTYMKLEVSCTFILESQKVGSSYFNYLQLLK